MSFSSNVKQELCRLPINRKLEAAAELYGILLYCNAFTADLVRITTESRDLAERLPRLMKKVFGFSFDQEPEESAGKLLFVMESQEKIHKMFAQFGLSAARDVTLHVNYGMLEEDEERLAFLRGAFLSGGSVTDPAKRYHLELTTSHYKVSRETCALLLDAGFSPKETTRGGNSILYFKQSDMIEDFLTAIGAPVCAMGVMEAKVEKDLRNGVNRRVKFEDMDTKTRDFIIGVNILGVWNVARAVWPYMLKANYGRIINTSSVTGVKVVDEGQSTYALTKGAVLGFTKALAYEGGPHGITVNAVLPGWVRTPKVEQVCRDSRPEDPESAMRDMAAFIPLKRLCNIDEIGDLVAFLASDDSKYITGTEQVIDGGSTLPETFDILHA